MSEITTKQDLLDFAKALEKLEGKKRQKYLFCKEHKFEHEALYLKTQLEIILEIRFEIENVANGLRKASEAKFSF